MSKAADKACSGTEHEGCSGTEHEFQKKNKNYIQVIKRIYGDTVDSLRGVLMEGIIHVSSDQLEITFPAITRTFMQY